MAANPFAQFAPAPAKNPFAEFAAPPPAPVEQPFIQPSEIPGPRRGDFTTGLGRGLASLADVTVGGVLPAAAQQIIYPFARIGSTPEQAQATTQSIVGKIEKPFGRAFGVVGTPEYEEEAGRQLVDFIGQNFQKGAKWISEKTGLPAPDVENMLGSLGLGATKGVKPAAKTAAKVGGELAADVIAGAKLPFEKGFLEPRRQRQSLADYARGPQIDAAKEAQRLGIVINPVDIQSTVGTRTLASMAGERGKQTIASTNQQQIRKVALKELNLPETTELTSRDVFGKARDQLAGPYNEVRKLPTLTADQGVKTQLESLRPDPAMIGSDRYAGSINAIIDDALVKVDAGMTGNQLLENVRTLRQRARKTYDNKNADLAALDVADTNLAVANALESMIESNISNPKLLTQFRDARQKMARTYAYENATDFNTGLVDTKKLSRITAKDNALTGDIKSLGVIAGNFPDVFSPKVSTPLGAMASLGRTGFAGTLGGLGGYTLGGYTGAAAGSLLGAAAGEIAQRLAANRLASPEYQAGLMIRDRRIPVNELAPPLAPPIPRERALVPYEPEQNQTVLMRGEGPYQPNFVFVPSPPGVPPQPIVTGVPQPQNRMLAAPSSASTLNALRAEDARRAQMSRELGTQAEARQAAAEAATRQPTRGEVMLVLDENGKLKYVEPKGTEFELPKTSSLDSAVEKLSGQMVGSTQTTYKRVSTGKQNKETGEIKFYVRKKEIELPATRQPQAFALTAEERIAWNKAKADIAEFQPEFKSLDDKAIASKMMDREWVQDAITKAREKAAAFEQIATRARTEQARREAAAKRERMMDLAEDLEDQLRLTPKQKVGQGPKTREAQRNMLRPQQDTNNLVR